MNCSVASVCNFATSWCTLPALILAFAALLNNAVNIQLNYMNAVHQYNQTLIELEYLTGK